MSNSNIDEIDLAITTRIYVDPPGVAGTEIYMRARLTEEAKARVQQELLKARLDELQKLLFTSQFGVPDGWEATNVLVKDIKRCIAELQASLKDGGKTE